MVYCGKSSWAERQSCLCHPSLFDMSRSGLTPDQKCCPKRRYSHFALGCEPTIGRSCFSERWTDSGKVCQGFSSCLCIVWADRRMGNSDTLQECLGWVSPRYTFEPYPVFFWLAWSNDFIRAKIREIVLPSLPSLHRFAHGKLFPIFFIKCVNNFSFFV